jgi:hypothetical protein
VGDPRPEAKVRGRQGLLDHRQLLNDPKGVGGRAMSKDPAPFVTRLRECLACGPFGGLTHRPALTVLGRTYARKHELNPEDWFLRRQRRVVSAPAWLLAVWHPLRRTSVPLPRKAQGATLREHGTIG